MKLDKFTPRDKNAIYSRALKMTDEQMSAIGKGIINAPMADVLQGCINSGDLTQLQAIDTNIDRLLQQ